MGDGLWIQIEMRRLENAQTVLAGFGPPHEKLLC
jgi:hypothetical protein